MKTVVKSVLVAVTLTGGTLVASTALSQGAGGPAPDPNRAAQQAVDVRQSVMTLISWNFGPLGGMPRGQVEYDAERVQLSADRLSVLAPMISEAFAMDTSATDIETTALPAVWENQDAFNDKASTLLDAVVQLKSAADADDQEASLAAIGALGQTCRSCHDEFRVQQPR